MFAPNAASVVIGFTLGWPWLAQVAIYGPFWVVCQAQLEKSTLTRGRCLVTSERVLVEGKFFWFSIRRGEWLRDLVGPAVRVRRGNEFVEFGDQKEHVLAGHRYNGVVVAPLQLHIGPESQTVLGIVRQAQRHARSAPPRPA
ncbi:hypothetical protein OG943_23205 [Amycolatopsis sp. NBC_00345]|uniref:hypothetical protein n=1 Tax=Amycolatopsis sp. NBC_00345 TaxID=2975955 RepID=UPI002E26885A